MNLQKAIESPFRDPNWVRKALVGSFIALLAIPFFFVGLPLLYGWGLRVAAQVAEGEDSNLPEWAEFGNFFVDGFKLWLATTLWMAPFVALILIIGLSPAAMEAVEEDAVLILFPFLLAIGAIPLFAVALALPLQFGVAAQTGSFVATINPIRVAAFVRDRPRQVMSAWLISAGSQYILGTIGFYLCCVGWLPALLYTYTLWGKAFGQVIRTEE